MPLSIHFYQVCMCLTFRESDYALVNPFLPSVCVLGFQRIWLFPCQPILTWKLVKGSQANSVEPDQMPHNVASEQGLHFLLTGFSIKNRIKATK